MYHNVKGNREGADVLFIHECMTPLILLMLRLMVVLDLRMHYNNTMNQEWNVISQKKLVDSPWYKLNIETVRLPSGKVLDDYYVREGMNAVLIVPRTHEGKFLLVRQYKHGAQQSVIEFPAGKIDAGESALIAAKRELSVAASVAAGWIALERRW